MITPEEAKQFQKEGEIRHHKNNLSSFKLRQTMGETGWESMIKWTEDQIAQLTCA